MSPGTRRLIIEADGGSRGNPGPAAYGALVRDADTGELLAEVAETIGVTTNNVAEYRGVLAGLNAARQIDPEATVEARLDSKLIVEQMSGRWKIKNADLRLLALEARRIFQPGQVTYTWVPRARNTHADRLVNEALDGTFVGASVVGGGVGVGADAGVGSAADVGAGAVIGGETEPVAAEPATPANQLAAWAPELGVPTTLLLVRHGRTHLTAGRRFSGGGVEGPELDQTGREQAERAAELLSASGAVAVVTSPMLRARQTAEAIARRLGVEIRVDEAWRECDFGAWDGMTLEEITKRYPAEVATWYGTTSAAPPGGESLDDLTARVAAARDDVLARHPGEPVVVVTHSMPVRALIRLTLDAPPEAIFRLQPGTGSVTEIQAFADGTVSINGFGHRP